MNYNPYASDEESNSRKDPGKGEPPLETTGEETIPPPPRFSCPLSSGSITALWGRGPQSGGTSRCRQRLLGPTASSIVGYHPLARCTLQPHATAKETSPRAAHLLKRELSTAALKYLPAGCSQDQRGQQTMRRSAKLRQCGGMGT